MTKRLDNPPQICYYEVREAGDLDELISFPKATINQEDNATIQNYLAEEASDVTSLIHKLAGIKDNLPPGIGKEKMQSFTKINPSIRVIGKQMQNY